MATIVKIASTFEKWAYYNKYGHWKICEKIVKMAINGKIAGHRGQKKWPPKSLKIGVFSLFLGFLAYFWGFLRNFENKWPFL